MKKVILRLVLVIAALLAAAIVLTDLFLGQIVKSGFNRYAPASVGTDTHITGATLSPVSGSGSLEGLYVSNPKGWTDPAALTAGKIRVEMRTSSIFSDKIVVNEIVIDDVAFNYETRFLSSNIGDLLSNATGASKNSAAQPQSNGHPKKFVIQHLKITNAKVKVGVGPTAVTLPLSTIELTNLGSGQGVSAPELTVILLRTILEGLAKASVSGAGHLGSAATGAVGAAAQGLLNSINKAIGGSK